MKQDERQQKILATALRREQLLKRNLCIDPFKINSRASPPQQTILEDYQHLHIYVVAGNQSGKSQLGGRIVAWKFTDTHPYWKRDPDWGTEPLFIIVAGRLGHQVEELWEKKIKPFLPPGSYKVNRQAGVLQTVVNRENENKILFTTHDKANQAWEKIQSFVAHHFWLDEMPSHAKYIEEAHRRVDAKQGQFIATFTPKVKNEDIRHMVDNVDPDIGVKYQMGKLDNPIYWGREEIEKKKIAHFPEEIRNCILFGHWMSGEASVFEFLYDTHVRDLPQEYNCQWPHTLAFDPAPNGIGGLVLIAQEPRTNKAFIVKAQYVKGKAPSDLVNEVRTIVEPYNIVRKVYDSSEPWFHNEATKMGFTGWIRADKFKRKKELITGLQQALLDRWMFSMPGLSKLYEEFRGAEWQDGDQGKIRNSTKYHLLDALQYGLDNLPEVALERINLSRDQEIIQAHLASMAAESAELEMRSEYKRTGRKKYRINNGKRPNRWAR